MEIFRFSCLIKVALASRWTNAISSCSACFALHACSMPRELPVAQDQTALGRRMMIIGAVEPVLQLSFLRTCNAEQLHPVDERIQVQVRL